MKQAVVYHELALNNNSQANMCVCMYMCLKPFLDSCQ